MTLPKLAPLANLSAASPDELRDVGRTLRSLGLDRKLAEPIVAAASQVLPAQRRAIRAYHARQIKSVGGRAMRMFLFADPVSDDEAKATLGKQLGRFLELGLLARHDGRVVSPFILSLVDDLFVLADDLAAGGEAVMALGETTVTLMRAAFPSKPLGSALDLGCGAGTAALVLAGRVKRVVATDINARALDLCKINAALNGVTNVEVRAGSLFAPVKGERFDLVVSQPPFVPRPRGAEQATFLFGGARGDELPLDLLRALPGHLTPTGRAVLIVEWPDDGGASPEARVEQALAGSATHSLVLKAPPSDASEHALGYASAAHPALGDDFDDDYLRRRAHLAEMRITGFVPTLIAVEPARGASSVRTLPTLPLGKIHLTSLRLDKMLAAREVAADRGRLLAADLKVPDATVLAQEQVGPGAEVPSTLEARFSPEAAVARIGLTPELLALCTAIHESKSVREGIATFSEMLGVDPAEGEERALPAIEKALLYGLLELT